MAIAYGEATDFSPADPLAAAVLLEPAVTTRSIKAGVAVECGGTYARGATILDLPGNGTCRRSKPSTRVDAAGFRVVVRALDRDALRRKAADGKRRGRKRTLPAIYACLDYKWG